MVNTTYLVHNVIKWKKMQIVGKRKKANTELLNYKSVSYTSNIEYGDGFIFLQFMSEFCYIDI